MSTFSARDNPHAFGRELLMLGERVYVMARIERLPMGRLIGRRPLVLRIHVLPA